MSEEQKWRYRANVSTSVKGVQSPETTVEFTGDDPDGAMIEETLRRQALLAGPMDIRYPVAKEGK
jgi:hypothetical protein